MVLALAPVEVPGNKKQSPFLKWSTGDTEGVEPGDPLIFHHIARIRNMQDLSLDQGFGQQQRSSQVVVAHPGPMQSFRVLRRAQRANLRLRSEAG